jgi:NADH:ubiquinone oxidoreductase subunit H
MIPIIIFLVALLLVTLGVAMYATYAERKVAAFMQDRIGPDRAGPFGLLQPVADGLKMIMKEDFMPANANRWLFFLGPAIAMTTALLTGVVIPWGGTLDLNGTPFTLQVADPDIGILYVFAMVSIGVYGIMLGGWASNNKYALLGAIRAASQMVSYELAMGMSIVALVILTGSLSLNDIVAATAGGRLEHHLPAARLPPLPGLRVRGMQPRPFRPARMRDRIGGRLPHGVQQHEARLLPLRRVREHVHQQCGHRHLVLRRL